MLVIGEGGQVLLLRHPSINLLHDSLTARSTPGKPCWRPVPTPMRIYAGVQLIPLSSLLVLPLSVLTVARDEFQSNGSRGARGLQVL
jgi:hypothetical protein